MDVLQNGLIDPLSRLHRDSADATVRADVAELQTERPRGDAR